MTFQLCIRQNISLDTKRKRMANMATPYEKIVFKSKNCDSNWVLCKFTFLDRQRKDGDELKIYFALLYEIFSLKHESVTCTEVKNGWNIRGELWFTKIEMKHDLKLYKGLSRVKPQPRSNLFYTDMKGAELRFRIMEVTNYRRRDCTNSHNILIS